VCGLRRLLLGRVILDAFFAWYSRTLNPDGYALLYPIAIALILFPLTVVFAILTLVFKLMSRKVSIEDLS